MKEFHPRSWVKDENGSMMSIAAVSLLAIVGIAALAVDASYHYKVKNELQTGVDAAALSASTLLRQPDPPLPPSVHTTVLRANTRAILQKSLNGDYGSNTQLLPDANIVRGNWDSSTKTFVPSTGTPPINALKLTAQMTQAAGNAAPTMFANIFGQDSVDIKTEAIAVQGDSPNCLVSLEPSQPAVYLNSGATLTALGCDLHVNSTHSDAVVLNGSDLDAEYLNVVGTAHGSSFNSTVVDNTASPKADPMAGMVPPPEASLPCTETSKYVVSSGQVRSLPAPQVFCDGIEVQNGGELTLEPGIHVIKNTKFSVQNFGRLYGTGVMVYLDDKDATIEFNSDARTQLSASKTGDYAGVVIFMNPAVTDPTYHDFNSDTTSYLNGLVYLPKGTFRVNSITTVKSSPLVEPKFFYIVSARLEINSASTVELKTSPVLSSHSVPRALRTYSTLVH